MTEDESKGSSPLPQLPRETTQADSRMWVELGYNADPLVSARTPEEPQAGGGGSGDQAGSPQTDQGVESSGKP